MINKGELFRLDLRVHKQMIMLKIYESDTLQEVIKRICENIKNGQSHRGQLKDKLLKSIKVTLKNQKIQGKIRQKLKNLIVSDNTLQVVLQTEKKYDNPAQTPFKLLQQNNLSSKEKGHSKSRKHFNYLQQAQQTNLKYVVNYNSSQLLTKQFNENQSSFLQRNTNNFVRSPEKQPSSSTIHLIKEQKYKNKKSQDILPLEDKLGTNYGKISSQRKYNFQEILSAQNNQRQLKHQEYLRTNQRNQRSHLTKEYDRGLIKHTYEFDPSSKLDKSKDHSKDDIQNRAYARKYSQTVGLNHNPNLMGKAKISQTFQQYKLTRDKSQSLVDHDRNDRTNKTYHQILKQQQNNASINYSRPKKVAMDKYNYEARSPHRQNNNSYVGSIKKLGHKYNYLGSQNLYPGCM